MRDEEEEGEGVPRDGRSSARSEVKVEAGKDGGSRRIVSGDVDEPKLKAVSPQVDPG